MSFWYSTQGNCCDSHTLCSLTSNDKFILPGSFVYSRQYTPMMRYPGNSRNNMQENNIISKSYYEQQQSNCKTCG